jgi:hypothetical protein
MEQRLRDQAAATGIHRTSAMDGLLHIDITSHERDVLLRGLRYVRSSIMLENARRNPEPLPATGKHRPPHRPGLSSPRPHRGSRVRGEGPKPKCLPPSVRPASYSYSYSYSASQPQPTHAVALRLCEFVLSRDLGLASEAITCPSRCDSTAEKAGGD